MASIGFGLLGSGFVFGSGFVLGFGLGFVLGLFVFRAVADDDTDSSGRTVSTESSARTESSGEEGNVAIRLRNVFDRVFDRGNPLPLVPGTGLGDLAAPAADPANGFAAPAASDGGVAAADEGSRYSPDSCEERSDAIIRRKVFDVLSDELGFDLGAPPAAPAAAREIGLGDLGTPAAHAIGFAAPTASDGGAAWGLPAADYGDVNSIRVGSGTNIQDNYSLVHVAKTNLAGKVLPTIIDDNVTIGKNGKALRKKFALGVVHETPAYLP